MRTSSLFASTRTTPMRLSSALILCVLFVAALISVSQGVKNARRSSQDFQWSPAVVFLQGENPYQEFLDGNKNRRLILTQAPNYAHALYPILAPIAALSWDTAKVVWAILNVAASVAIVVFLARRIGLNLELTLFVLFTFLCSTPFRSGISNGQQATFTLAAFCATLLEASPANLMWAGLGYLKYSYAPPLAFYLLLRNGVKAVAWSMLPLIVGYFIFLARVGGDPVAVMVQPLQTAAHAVGLGTADLMSLISLLLPQKDGAATILTTYLPPMAVAATATYVACRQAETPAIRFSIVCLLPLVLFKHLPYDFIFLLPAFICAIAYFQVNRVASLTTIGIVLANWFGLVLVDNFYTKRGHPLNSTLFVSTNFVLCVTAIVSLFVLGKTLRRSLQPQETSRAVPAI